MSMTPKERLLAAINHQEPDRVPILIGVSNATSIQMKAYRRLKNHLGIEAPDTYIYSWPELGIALVDEETLQHLHGDVRGVLDLEPASVLESNLNRDPHSPYISSWGTGQIEIQDGEWYSGIYPLQEATTPADLNEHSWPDMDDPTRVSHVREQARRLAEEQLYGIMGTPWLLFPLERAFSLQGMETFLLNLAVYPEFAQALLQKNLELCKQLMGNFLGESGDYLDIIKIGDDLGTQESLLMSPATYREILKPIHADLITFIKERTDAKVLFHTDGDVFPLIGDLIEIGVDILNPIQTSAGQMSNLDKLKADFGKEIVFCGGIDTHHYLPHGTPQEVDDEVKRVIKILGPGGGYLVSSVHTIMNDVPPENILAMINAVEKHGQYPL
jgi:uroporphyrinogen decarboxylase